MKEKLLQRLEPWNQQHLLAFWDELPPDGRRRLARQIEQLDLKQVDRLYRRYCERSSEPVGTWGRVEPPPAFRLDAGGNRFSPAEAAGRAESLLRAGRVGVILVAGGQGTRLGFDEPKGLFPIGPLSHRTLLQMHIEQLRAVSRRWDVPIPLYLMTSPATHDRTVECLRSHGNFGLDSHELITVFCQGTMPAVDRRTGRLLLAEKDRLVSAPDGHGGTLAALEKHGCLDDMRRRGIEHVYYFQVDNPLAAICEPELIGCHALSGSEFSLQAVARTEPDEKVGNIVSIDGQLRVIEYFHLPKELAEQRDPDGRLAYWAGSIAIHVFRVDFLCRMAASDTSLPFHCAEKRVSYLAPDGRPVEPEEPNALKFERFIFDLLPRAESTAVMEADPRERFAPLKNAPGQERDTPEHVRAAIADRSRRWLRRCGAVVEGSVPIEISPFFALDAEELKQKIPPGTRFAEPVYLE